MNKLLFGALLLSIFTTIISICVSLYLIQVSVLARLEASAAFAEARRSFIDVQKISETLERWDIE